MIHMLKEFYMHDCKPMQTPMLERMMLYATNNDAFTKDKIYQQVVGKLIYLTITRPNVAFLVCIVGRYLQDLKKAQMVRQ